MMKIATKIGETELHEGDEIQYEIPPMRAIYQGKIVLFDDVWFVEKDQINTPLSRCRLIKKM